METIDEREMQTTTKEKQAKAERSKGNRSYSETMRAKWFCCIFKLGFLQLICKATLIFNSNLELTLWIILKQRIIWVKATLVKLVIILNLGLRSISKRITHFFYVKLFHISKKCWCKSYIIDFMLAKMEFMSVIFKKFYFSRYSVKRVCR